LADSNSPVAVRHSFSNQSSFYEKSEIQFEEIRVTDSFSNQGAIETKS